MLRHARGILGDHLAWVPPFLFAGGSVMVSLSHRGL